MGEDRLFTKEELEAMGKRTLDLLLESLENGNEKEAKNLAQRMYNEFLGMHDLYRDWITHVFTFIGKRLGDDVLREAMAETVAGYSLRLGKRYGGKRKRRQIEMLIAGFRGHLQPFDIEEDDEKLTITPKPCGIGGRLIRDAGYDPPCNFFKIRRPQPMTFNREDFPAYCAHCYFQNISPMEPGGKPLFKTKPSEDLGKTPCRIYIYK
jgi:hypothetical protein